MINVILKVKEVGCLCESSFTNEKALMTLPTEYNPCEALDKMQEPISLDEEDNLVLNT